MDVSTDWPWATKNNLGHSMMALKNPKPEKAGRLKIPAKGENFEVIHDLFPFDSHCV